MLYARAMYDCHNAARNDIFERCDTFRTNTTQVSGTKIHAGGERPHLLLSPVMPMRFSFGGQLAPLQIYYSKEIEKICNGANWLFAVGRQPRYTRRQLLQQRCQLPLRVPQQQLARQPQQQCRSACGLVLQLTGMPDSFHWTGE